MEFVINNVEYCGNWTVENCGNWTVDMNWTVNTDGLLLNKIK